MSSAEGLELEGVLLADWVLAWLCADQTPFVPVLADTADLSNLDFEGGDATWID